MSIIIIHLNLVNKTRKNNNNSTTHKLITETIQALFESKRKISVALSLFLVVNILGIGMKWIGIFKTKPIVNTFSAKVFFLIWPLIFINESVLVQSYSNNRFEKLLTAYFCFEYMTQLLHFFEHYTVTLI